MEDLRAEKVKILEEIKNFNQLLSRKMHQNCVEEVRELLEVNRECVEKLKIIFADDVDEKFIEIADLYLKFTGLGGKDRCFFQDNWERLIQVQGIFLESIVGIYRSLKRGEWVCACCGAHTVFEPLPSFYELKTEQYGGVRHTWEFLNEEQYTCLQCMASDRDRLMIAFLKKLGLPYMKKGIKILHFAPSAAIERWIIDNCPNADYESTDLYMKNVTFQSDISDMSMIDDNAYDFFICSHVLEYVKDDGKAMRELQRILKPDGIGIFLVPVALDAEEIDEEWGLTGEENWKRFGQDDHCRLYTHDGVIDRLTRAGFFVHPVGKSYFGEKLFAENAFTDTSTLYLLSKTRADPEALMESQIKKGRPDDEPLVSVIMTAYNHEAFVAEAIESVINQTYKNIEFLVADDGSADRTPEIMRRFAQYFAQEYYFGENYGGYELFLKEKTKGKYVALINSDDVWEKDKLEKQVSFLENNPDYAACFTWTDYVNDNLEILLDDIFIKANRSSERWMYEFFKKDNSLCHPSVLIRRQAYIDAFQERYCYVFRQVPDFAAWVGLVQKEKIYVFPQRLVKMRRHGLGYSENVSAFTEKTMCRLVNEYTFLWYKEIRDMENGFFRRTFSGEFVDPDAESDEEIACEKYFLLKNRENVWYNMAAVLLLFDISARPEVRKCFEEKYHYKRKDIFDEYLDVGLGAEYMKAKRLSREVNELKEILKKKENADAQDGK